MHFMESSLRMLQHTGDDDEHQDNDLKDAEPLFEP